MMATLARPVHSLAGEHRFFLLTAWLLAVLITGGFALNLAAGRSSFAVPLVYHLHAFVFFGFVALYVTQATLAATGNVAVHRRLGLVAAVWIPLMTVLAIWLTLVTLQVLGGPPVFAQSEFLAVNLFHIAAFAGLGFAALAFRRRPDWHKRLMFGAMVTVGAPRYRPVAAAAAPRSLCLSRAVRRGVAVPDRRHRHGQARPRPGASGLVVGAACAGRRVACRRSRRRDRLCDGLGCRSRGRDARRRAPGGPVPAAGNIAAEPASLPHPGSR